MTDSILCIGGPGDGMVVPWQGYSTIGVVDQSGTEYAYKAGAPFGNGSLPVIYYEVHKFWAAGNIYSIAVASDSQAALDVFTTQANAILALCKLARGGAMHWVKNRDEWTATLPSGATVRILLQWVNWGKVHGYRYRVYVGRNHVGNRNTLVAAQKLAGEYG